jgi:hypothetical protein
MAAGLVTGIIAFAVGAVLDFALTTNPDQHGFNVHTVGVILMIVGAIAAACSIIAFVANGTTSHRHRTVVDDGQGNVVQREDTFR